MKSEAERKLLGRLMENTILPVVGQISLNYRCNFDCIHCYCKGSKGEELSAKEWFKILDAVCEEGCLYLILTGGEPLIRKDFLEIYSYAKQKGFLVSIFTNGLGLTDEIIDFLQKMPPASIEITLNAISEDVYETITKTKGAFKKVMRNIHKLAGLKLPILLKSNFLKQNKHQIGQIKAFAEGLLGKFPDKYAYKCDPFITPRLNGDLSPLNHRLSFEEITEVWKQDSDLWREHQEYLKKEMGGFKRDADFLYHCNSWGNNFFINPSGKLRFCDLTNKYCADLKKETFRDGFYKTFPKLLKQRFKSGSKCRSCSLRPICRACPALAALETGDEEAGSIYHCELAHNVAKASDEISQL